MTEIRRSMVIQLGDHDGRKMVAISAVVTVTVETEVDGRKVEQEHSKTKAISAAVYDDDAAAWRAVREFASARQLEHAEELIERPKKVAPAPPVASPDDPF